MLVPPCMFSPRPSLCFHDSLHVIQIVDVQFLSAMNPTAGSFEICERLQRHFATFSCQMPSSSDLKLVYSSILSGHMLGWGDSINTMCARIVDASILIHSLVSQSEHYDGAFRSTANQLHFAISTLIGCGALSSVSVFDSPYVRLRFYDEGLAGFHRPPCPYHRTNVLPLPFGFCLRCELDDSRQALVKRRVSIASDSAF